MPPYNITTEQRLGGPSRLPKRRDRDPREKPTAKPSIPQSTYIQAYEAQLVYDAPERAARVISRDGKGGKGLMRWQGQFEGDEGEETGQEVWADRHDIIHLLTSLLTPSAQRAQSKSRVSSGSPGSVSSATTSSSWNDLPSDLEETFFLSGSEEIEEYERGKKRLWMEALREERLKKRQKEDEARAEEGNGKGKGREAGWGEDEEAPPEPILTLMSHTATSLLSSPNPSLLELRILANHASDPRFEFLRGRYKTTWERLKAEARRESDVKSGRAGKEKKVVGVLLGRYESSDDEDGDEDRMSDTGESPPPPPPEMVPSPPPPPTPPPDMTLGEERHSADRNRDAFHMGAGNAVTEGSGADSEEKHELEKEKQRLRRERAEAWKRKRALQQQQQRVDKI